MPILNIKLTTHHHHFTRRDQSKMARRRPYSMPVMDITVYLSTQRIAISPRLSLHGVDIVTKRQGCSTSGDGYTRRYDEIIAELPNKTKCMDDVLLWADSLEESFFQTFQWLDICGRHGITLNPDKFVFGENVVEFAGFEITPDSVRPCMKYLQAILDFPVPIS